MKPLLPPSCMTKKKLSSVEFRIFSTSLPTDLKLLNMQISNALTINYWKCIYQFLLKPAEFKDKSRTFI